MASGNPGGTARTENVTSRRARQKLMSSEAFDMVEYAHDAAGMPAADDACWREPHGRPSWASENPKPMPVRDLSAHEAAAEDAGIIREDMTPEQRCESLSAAVHDMIGRERVLLTALQDTQRELEKVLAAHAPVQSLAAYSLAELHLHGPAIVATIEAAEKLGHTVAAELSRDSFGLSLTIGVRVAA